METNYRLKVALREVKKDIITFLVVFTLTYTLGLFTGVFITKHYMDKQTVQIDIAEQSDTLDTPTYYLK